MILKANLIANRMLSTEEEDVRDPLVITPFPDVEELKKSGAASIDLRLGTWFSYCSVKPESPFLKLTTSWLRPHTEQNFLPSKWPSCGTSCPLRRPLVKPIY